MALGLTKVTAFKAGNKRFRIYDVTFDSSYPTGGEALSAANVDLHKIESVSGSVAKTSDGATAYVTVYDYTNSKLQAVYGDNNNASDGPLIEAPNTTDLSSYSARLTFIGF